MSLVLTVCFICQGLLFGIALGFYLASRHRREVGNQLREFDRLERIGNQLRVDQPHLPFYAPRGVAGAPPPQREVGVGFTEIRERANKLGVPIVEAMEMFPPEMSQVEKKPKPARHIELEEEMEME